MVLYAAMSLVVLYAAMSLEVRCVEMGLVVRGAVQSPAVPCAAIYQSQLNSGLAEIHSGDGFSSYDDVVETSGSTW